MEPKIKYNISGLRGVVGKTFTPPVLMDNLIAFSRYLEKRGYHKGEKRRPKVFVGRDARASGEAASAYIIGLLNLLGIDVDFGGILPTPTILYTVKNGGYDGGVAITASHNPIEYNALKLAKFGGYFLFPVDVEEISSYIDMPVLNFPTYESIGTTKLISDAWQSHIDNALKNFDKDIIKKANLKVAVDFCNSTAKIVFPHLFDMLDVSYKSIFDSINGTFERVAEPNFETMQYLSKIMQKEKFDAGFVFDPDADRVAVLFEDGKVVSEEYTLALSYYHFCKNRAGGDLVVNLSTSSMVKWIAQRFGYNVYYSPVGEINVTMKMLEKKAVFGGEGNGGVIYFPVSNSRDTVVAVLFILELLAIEKCRLSTIAEQIPQMIMRKQKFETTGKFDSAKIEKIKYLFTDHGFNIQEINETDGIRLDFENGFCHIRSSNTEPVIRVIYEAQDKNIIEKIEDLIPDLKNICK